MSANDVKITTVGNGSLVERTYRVASGAIGSIDVGEPVKIGGNGNNFVILLATGDPEIGTDRMVGIAAAISTDTVADDGTVRVWIPDANSVMTCAATTPANIDTAAELLAIDNDSVTFDLTGAIFTINENEGDDPNVHGLMIIGGDINAGTLDFILNPSASQAGLV